MSLENLLAQATGREHGHKCWATYAQGDAKRFIEALEELEKTQPGKVNRAEVSKILQTEFGINVSRETVRNHLVGLCRCGR